MDYLDYGLSHFKGFKYSQDLRMKDGYIDCSSLVGRSLKGAGYNVNPAMTTASMNQELTKLGFIKLKFDPDNLQVGDILWRKGHTAFYIGNKQVFGGHTHSGASILPLYRKSGNQMFNFTHLFRKSS